MSYAELLRDPRWQRKRLEVMSGAGFKCEKCGSATKTLNVHHVAYVRGRRPWEYPDDQLKCLCEDCHSREHAGVDARSRSRQNALELERNLAGALLAHPQRSADILERIALIGERFQGANRTIAEIVNWLCHETIFADIIAATLEVSQYSPDDDIEIETALGWRGADEPIVMKELDRLRAAAEGRYTPAMIDKCVDMLARRAIEWEFLSLDQELPLADNSRKDSIILKKLQLTREMNALGLPRWKEYSFPRRRDGWRNDA